MRLEFSTAITPAIQGEATLVPPMEVWQYSVVGVLGAQPASAMALPAMVKVSPIDEAGVRIAEHGNIRHHALRDSGASRHSRSRD